MTWRSCYCWFIICSMVATSTSCPTWHYYNNDTGQCKCGYGLVCRGKVVEITNDHCATSSEEEGDYHSGICPYMHTLNSVNRLYSEMPSNASQLDEFMCGPYNRKGLLCGECKDGYGPAVYSLSRKCVKCSSNMLKYFISTIYLLLQFCPTTLIFICLVIFRFKITSGPMLGYLLFCQAIMITLTGQHYFTYDYIQSNVSLSLRALLLVSVTVSQFWNLQFFWAIIPPFCISEKLNSIDVHMLNFIPAIYPFVLFVTSCILMELHARNYRIVGILWKPFRIILSKAGITTVTSDALFHAFASLIFLSNISVLFATCNIVVLMYIHNSTGFVQERVVYIDPTVQAFNHKSFYIF